jgi:hypothetical protein
VDTGWFGLIWVGFVVFVIWFVFWGRDSSIRYQVQYSTGSEMVTVDREPRDCDFMSAPMGSKDCKYEKDVIVTTFGKDVGNGRPIVSFDQGKTYSWNDGGPISGTRVYVTWRKVQP